MSYMRKIIAPYSNRRPYRLAVRTSDSHSGNMGSIPVRGAKNFPQFKNLVFLVWLGVINLVTHQLYPHSVLQI